MIEMSEDYIYETFATYLNELFDDLFFHIAYQTNNSPKKYGTIYKIAERTDREHRAYFDRENPKERLSSIEIFKMQIDLYSDKDNLIDYAKTVKAHLKSQRGRDYFKRKGFTLLDFSSIRNLPEQKKQGFEYRRSFDIDVGYVDDFIFDVDYITKADISHIF